MNLNIPGLSGFIAAEDQARQNGLANIQQVGGIMGILNAQAEMKKRATDEEKQRGALEALQGLFVQPPAQAAGPSGAAAQGGTGPMQPGLPPAVQGYQPVPLDRLARAAAAGVNIGPFLKLNDAAKPNTEHFDAGNEILVRDRNTGQVISRFPKGAAPASVPFDSGGMTPEEYRNYQMGKSTAGASRNITNVNSFTPASEEAQRDFIKSTRTTYDSLKQAPVALESIEKAKALIPQARGFMGPGGDSLLEAAKFMNNRLGMSINTEGVKSAEELRTRIFFNVMDNLKKMDAQPSEMQQRLMMDALGKLGTDPNALPQVLDAFAGAIRGKVDLHNKEVQGAITRGVKFPYDPLISLPEAKPAAPAREAGPTKGVVVDGWEFLGGDPANKMSWRKK
jgi:hypothetical protein